MSCTPSLRPRQNIDPRRWGIFLIDVLGAKSSIFMMRFGAYIPLAGVPFCHSSETFPKLEK